MRYVNSPKPPPARILIKYLQELGSGDVEPKLSFHWQKLKAIRFDHDFYDRLIASAKDLRDDEARKSNGSVPVRRPALTNQVGKRSISEIIESFDGKSLRKTSRGSSDEDLNDDAASTESSIVVQYQKERKVKPMEDLQQERNIRAWEALNRRVARKDVEVPPLQLPNGVQATSREGNTLIGPATKPKADPRFSTANGLSDSPKEAKSVFLEDEDMELEIVRAFEDAQEQGNGEPAAVASNDDWWR
jgi:hypothetical protein